MGSIFSNSKANRDLQKQYQNSIAQNKKLQAQLNQQNQHFNQKIQELLNNQKSSQVKPDIQYRYQYITKYKTDPQAEKKINQLQKQIKQLLKEFQQQKLKDFKAAGEKVNKIKNFFFSELQKQKFYLLPGKSVVFIGRTSVGKSTLLNTLFKIKLKTSKMRCTTQLQIIFNNGNVCVFDCPGFDDNFNILSHTENVLKYFGKIENIYYLYDGSIEQDIVKAALAMNKKLYFVRTKCDPDDNPDENDQVRAADNKMINNFGIKNTQLFLTSKKEAQGFKNDNAFLLKHIMS